MATIQILDTPYNIPYPDYAKTWRYMQYYKLEDLIKKRAIYFSSINKLRKIEDSLEGTHSRPIQDILGDLDLEYSKAISSTVIPPTEIKYDWKEKHQDRANQTYVNCWHINNSESAWMWKKYAKSSESIILQSTLGRLRRCFKGMNDYLFMGCIQYIDHETFVSGPRHSLDSFMRKNKSFENENELRIIFYSGLYDNRVSDRVYKSVDVTKMIEQITCHPHCSDDFVRKVGELLNENSFNIRMKKSEIIL